VHRLFPDKQVTSLADYVNALSKLPKRDILWFRGQTTLKTLLPTLARQGPDWISNEPMLMNRFRQNAVSLLPQSPRIDSDWSWLLLMQHYGVPTRLLDWTENALVALFFSVMSVSGRDTRATKGCVWVLDPLALNSESNITTAGLDIPTLDVATELHDYVPDEVSKTPRVRPPVAVLAMRLFPRLVAQSGVFTLIHREAKSLERIRQSKYVGRILVPGSAKSRIIDELTTMGVTRLSLFPELESVAIHVKTFLR
jgi:FRG domain